MERGTSLVSQLLTTLVLEPLQEQEQRTSQEQGSFRARDSFQARGSFLVKDFTHQTFWGLDPLLLTMLEQDPILVIS